MTENLSRTLTFLMTDIEGSTSLWESQPEAMRLAMVVHDAVIEQAVKSHRGEVVRPRGEGDSRFAVFAAAADAVRAANDIQHALHSDVAGLPFPIKVRIGVHTGTADLREGDYYGTTVNRCARIRGLGHGGQTLLSQATAELVRDDLSEGLSLVGLGTHRLKGLTRPETIYQLWLSDLPNEFPPLASPPDHAIHLPASPTALIGRERELIDVNDLLAQDAVRLVTFTGPGGTGKTRLSLELGRSMLDQFPDGVFFVDLAPISDPSLVATTIAHAMGIREGGGRPPFDNLKDFLAGKKLLLILDNLEQVIVAAPIIAELLTVEPQIKVIATSRIPLQIRGEREYPLPTLPLPPSGTTLTPTELLDYGAVRLFVRQAQAVRPDFELTEANATAVVQICRRLDGLPLALEIAAARVRILPPQAMLRRLDTSLNLLVGGAADLPSRQQTMRAAIDWSYDLLGQAEQRLFARLGVFVGGFTMETAETIANFDGTLDVFGGLEVLLNNSLVRQVESITDEPRFALLQTIRDYAVEKLDSSGEMDTIRERHAQYYYHYSVERWNDFYGPKTTELMMVVEDEHDNWRAAMSWSLEPSHDLLVAAQITVLLLWFWYRHGHMQEGREWCERIMRATEPIGGVPYGMSLIGAGMMAMWQSDLAVANERVVEGLRLSEIADYDLGIGMGYFACGVVCINQGRDREGYTYLMNAAERFDQRGNPWDTGSILIHLANISLGLGDLDGAEQWLNQALPLTEQLGDGWQIAFCLNNFGELARTRGDYTGAHNYYLRAEAMFREADAASDLARLIHTLGYIALHDGDLNEARKLFQGGLTAFRKLGNKRGMAECLAGLAAVSSDPAWAAQLLSAATAQMAVSGAAWWPADRVEIERSRQQLVEALGEQDFGRLWKLGQAMTLDQAMAWASGIQTEA